MIGPGFGSAVGESMLVRLIAVMAVCGALGGAAVWLWLS